MLMAQEWTTARLLWPLLRPYRHKLFFIPVLAGLGCLFEGLSLAMFAPVAAIVSGQAAEINNPVLRMLAAIDYGNTRSIQLATTAAIIVVLTMMKSSLFFAIRAVSEGITSAVGQEVRCQTFSQLMAVSYRFWVQRTAGTLLETLGRESWRVVDAASVLCYLVAHVAVAAMFVCLLIFVSWRLTLAVAVGAALITVLLRPLSRRVRAFSDDEVRSNACLWQRMWDSAAGIRVIHAFGLQSRTQDLFARDSDRVRRCISAVEVSAAGAQAVSEILHVCLLLTCLLVAIARHVEYPEALVFVLIVFRLHPHLNMADKERVQLAALLPSVQNVTDLLSEADKPYIRSGTSPFTRFQREIRLVSVSYSYGADTAALQDVSAVIPKGGVTAIVGPSGAGKTTLLHLLMRFDDPASGEIFIDGKPLRSLSLENWRSHIALSGQDMHLFAATVRENIGYGKRGATDEEIEQAAADACAHGFIMDLPQGYDTLLGDMGARLSGGERQRIALARAFLRNADILLLDEATSAVDALTEQAINQAIGRFSRQQTVIVVAHRLSTVRNADRVIVLDGGGIVECGTPQDLISSNRLFAEMYSLQTMERAV